MMRLFIGLSLPAAVRDRLAALQSGLPGARWVLPENLHLTLRFVGELAGDGVEDLDAALTKVAAPGFEFRLKGLDTFGGGGGGAKKIRALWTAAEPPAPLVHLQAKIESAARLAGLAPEGRKFKPHVTIARFKNARRLRMGEYLQSHAGFQAGPVPVPAFTLYRSHLGQGGAHYERLADYPLGAEYPLQDGPNG